MKRYFTFSWFLLLLFLTWLESQKKNLFSFTWFLVYIFVWWRNQIFLHYIQLIFLESHIIIHPSTDFPIFHTREKWMQAKNTWGKWTHKTKGIKKNSITKVRKKYWIFLNFFFFSIPNLTDDLTQNHGKIG